MDSIPMVIITGPVPTHAIGLMLSGMRHRRHYSTDRQTQFLVKTRVTADVMKKTFTLRERSGRPNRGGGHSKTYLSTRQTIISVTPIGGDALLQPRPQRTWRTNSQGSTAATDRKTPLSIQVAVSC
jgi:hypothetical protein